MKEKRKSIRDYNTSGMSIWEREKLFDKVEPIPINQIVYRSGDFTEETKKIIVDKDNQKIVTMFWNCLYFDNYEDAERATRRAHYDYASYLAEAFRR